MKIVVKQSDQLTSKLHKNKAIPEFLIYTMLDEKPITCELVYGVNNKDKAISETIQKLLLKNVIIEGIEEMGVITTFKS